MLLLRARAIETQCYVVAAAQCGRHHEKRASYGHSMVVDPWGTVVAAVSKDQAFALPELTLTICSSYVVNNCLCSSTAGLDSMAIWVTHCLKTFDFCPLRPPSWSWWRCDLQAGPRRSSPHLENLVS